MNLDETSLVPIFVQIAEWVEDEIIEGHLKEGDKVPSKTQFAMEYNINPATALKGINMLVDEGIIYKKRGIGMFVAEGAKALICEKRKNKFLNEQLINLLKEAKKLGISKEEVKKMIDKIGN